MDLLRWILLGVGVLVIVGVYWWSRRNARDEERFFRTEPGVGGTDDDSDDPLFATAPRSAASARLGSDAAPLLTTDDGEPDLEAVQRELSSLQALLRTEERSAARPVYAPAEADDEPDIGGAADTDPAPHPVEREKLVVLYLVAHADQVFSAAAIGDALRALGLKYGEMHIYHRYPDGGPGADRDAPVFGVANLVEPGTLDPATLEPNGTHGLTLFLQLPGPMPPLAAFDLFAGTAQQLASRLNGELRDKTRTVVSRQMLEHLRDEIQDYARRLHLHPQP